MMYKKVNNTSASLAKKKPVYYKEKSTNGSRRMRLLKEIHFCRLRIMCTMQRVKLDG